MELYLKRVKIKNFRKFVSEVEFDLSNGVNKFSGDNGAGKSTILSAITWCLFGYDINGKTVSNFTIFPIIDDVEQTDMIPTVELELNSGLVLKRVFAKNKTQCFIGNYDEEQEIGFVKYGNRDYADYIAANVIDTDDWEKLSNLEKLPRLHWEELKEMVFGLLGGIEDDLILANDNYSSIENDIRTHGVEATHSNYKNTKRSIKQTIDKEENIVKYNKDQRDSILNETEVKDLASRKETIDIELKGYQEKVNIQNEITRGIHVHNNKYDGLVTDKGLKQIAINSNLERITQYKKFYSENSFDGEALRRTDLNKINSDETQVDYDISGKQREIINYESRITGVKSQIDELTKKNVKLIAEGKELNATEIKINSDDCATCGQTLPEEMKQKALTNLRNARDGESARIMTNITNNKSSKETLQKSIDSFNESITSCKTDIAELSSKKSEFDKLRTEINNKEYLSQNETPKQVEYREVYEQLYKDNAVLEGEITALNTEIETHGRKEMPTNVLESPTELITESEQIAIKLDRVKNIDLEITAHTEELDTYAKKLVTINEKLQQISKFKSAKSKMITDRIKEEFNMVEFITEEQQKNGDTIETFKIAYGGKEYADLSTGEKIQVITDLVTGIQRLKNIRIPILIDRYESVNMTKIKMETQVIAAERIPQDKVELVFTQEENLDKFILKRDVEVPVGLKVTANIDGKEIDITEYTKEVEEVLPGQGTLFDDVEA